MNHLVHWCCQDNFKKLYFWYIFCSPLPSPLSPASPPALAKTRSFQVSMQRISFKALNTLTKILTQLCNHQHAANTLWRMNLSRGEVRRATRLMLQSQNKILSILTFRLFKRVLKRAKQLASCVHVSIM